MVVDTFFLCVLIIYNISGYAIVIWVINHYDLHPVPAVVLNVEQVGIIYFLIVFNVLLLVAI